MSVNFPIIHCLLSFHRKGEGGLHHLCPNPYHLSNSNPVKRYSDIQVIKIATIIHPRTRKKTTTKDIYARKCHSLLLCRRPGPGGPSPPFIYPMAYYPLAPFSIELPIGYASTDLIYLQPNFPPGRSYEHHHIPVLISFVPFSRQKFARSVTHV